MLKDENELKCSIKFNFTNVMFVFQDSTPGTPMTTMWT